METMLCWSSGKDSTATGILAKLNNIKIDEIITVMPDPFSEEMCLLEKFESFMEQKVTVVIGPTFEDYFFRKKVRGKYVGTIYGWPFTAYKTCGRILKWGPMQKYLNGRDCKCLLGIATNENRNILKPNESLLIKYGYTEDDARKLCVEYDLLNPLYKHFKRLGCVRCPKQSKKALGKVKILEPKKYEWMLKNDHLSPINFRPGKTFHEFIKPKDNEQSD